MQFITNFHLLSVRICEWNGPSFPDPNRGGDKSDLQILNVIFFLSSVSRSSLCSNHDKLNSILSQQGVQIYRGLRNFDRGNRVSPCVRWILERVYRFIISSRLNLKRARGEIPRWISRSNGRVSWLYTVSNLWYPLFKDSVWSSQDKLVSLVDFEEKGISSLDDISRCLLIWI